MKARRPTAAPRRSPRARSQGSGPWGSAARDLQPMIFGYRTSQCLYVVAKLGVPDRLTGGPRTAAELARDLGVQADPLYRVLRALAALGVFTQDASDRFGLTPLSERLTDAHPESLKYLTIFQGDAQYAAFGALLHSVRTGETAYDHLVGMGHFEYLAKHPEASAVFNAAMAEGARGWRTSPEFLRFPGKRLLVDVGGGRGQLMGEMLRANPRIRGILFDMPSGGAEASDHLTSLGLADRCDVVFGSMFESVPAGGDVYVMSRILHDWPDDKATAILANVRKAVARDGMLVLFESVLPRGSDPSPAKQSDLTMLVMTGGRERAEGEWRTLLEAAGFALTRVRRTGGRLDRIEATPA